MNMWRCALTEGEWKSGRERKKQVPTKLTTDQVPVYQKDSQA